MKTVMKIRLGYYSFPCLWSLANTDGREAAGLPGQQSTFTDKQTQEQERHSSHGGRWNAGKQKYSTFWKFKSEWWGGRATEADNSGVGQKEDGDLKELRQ